MGRWGGSGRSRPGVRLSAGIAVPEKDVHGTAPALQGMTSAKGITVTKVFTQLKVGVALGHNHQVDRFLF